MLGSVSSNSVSVFVISRGSQMPPTWVGSLLTRVVRRLVLEIRDTHLAEEDIHELGLSAMLGRLIACRAFIPPRVHPWTGYSRQ
jgi:hypothetical protein